MCSEEIWKIWGCVCHICNYYYFLNKHSESSPFGGKIERTSNVSYESSKTFVVFIVPEDFMYFQLPEYCNLKNKVIEPSKKNVFKKEVLYCGEYGKQSLLI